MVKVAYRYCGYDIYLDCDNAQEAHDSIMTICEAVIAVKEMEDSCGYEETETPHTEDKGTPGYA